MSRGPGRVVGALGALALAALLLPVASSTVAATPAPAGPAGPVSTGSTVVDVADTSGPHPEDPRAPASAVGAAAEGGVGTLTVNSSDPRDVPNTGLRTVITQWPYLVLPDDSAFQVSVEEVIGPAEAVFGIFENSTLTPVPFFAVFGNGTFAPITDRIWVSDRLEAGEAYDFRLELANGTNWTLSVNGEPFGGAGTAYSSYDFGASEATWAVSEAFAERAIYPGSPVAPGLLTVPLALGLDEDGAWYVPSPGIAVYDGTAGSQWGVSGSAQNGSLALGEVETGTSVADAANGTVLWSGSPTPAHLVLAVAPTPVRGNGAASVDVVLTDASGAALAGVPVVFNDSLGAAFAPSVATTAANGAASVEFLAPNVSAPETDSVTASVGVPGYAATNRTSVPLVPGTRLTVRLLLDPSGHLVDGSATLRVEVNSSDDAPAVDVAVTVSASGPVVVTAGNLSTNLAGAAVTTLSATGPGEAVVVVRALGNGSWGEESLEVRTERPTVGAGEVAAVLAASVVLAAAAGVVSAARHRRGRRPGRTDRLARPPSGLP